VQTTITQENNETTHRRMSGSIAYWTGLAAVAFTALAAITGSFSWYFSSRASDEKDAALERFNEQSQKEVARANQMAGEANERAGQANERAAKLNERAEGLAKEAEEAKLQVARVQQSIMPRAIVDADQKRAITNLLKFKGTRFIISFAEKKGESEELAEQLTYMLRQAGWKAVAPEKEGEPRGETRTSTGLQPISEGVIIRSAVTLPSKPEARELNALTGEAASALSKELNDSNISAKFKRDSGSDLLESGIVFVHVATLPVYGRKVGPPYFLPYVP
jgi:hypothetical protein